MATVIHDTDLEKRLQAERAATGADRYDEVWEGTYMMAPMPNNEHQHFVGRLTRILDELVTDHGRGIVLPGTNVSDRVENWQKNYRVPDVAVFLDQSVVPEATAAQNHGSFWLGGPDLAIEVVSENDLSREKLEFYARTGTRELLIIDRAPWQLELYHLNQATLKMTDRATLDETTNIQLRTCPLQLELQAADPRPQLLATSTIDDRTWTI